MLVAYLINITFMCNYKLIKKFHCVYLAPLFEYEKRPSTVSTWLWTPLLPFVKNNINILPSDVLPRILRFLYSRQPIYQLKSPTRTPSCNHINQHFLMNHIHQFNTGIMLNTMLKSSRLRDCSISCFAFFMLWCCDLLLCPLSIVSFRVQLSNKSWVLPAGLLPLVPFCNLTLCPLFTVS